MPGRGQKLILLAFFLALVGFRSPCRAFDYPVEKIPAGEMVLRVPLNSYLNTDFLDIPVEIKKPFLLGRYEVSNRLWNQCHQAGGCSKAASNSGPEQQDHPVVLVNWHEAAQFARWLSKATGKTYRLPTEGEWFYAATLGQGYTVEDKTYDYSQLEEIRRVPKQTFAAGTFGKNGWGLYDMIGNVWEWTLSCYSLAPERLLEPVSIEKLQDPNCCLTRITGGEHRAHVPDFFSDTYNGGCATLKPAANLGFRLVEET